MFVIIGFFFVFFSSQPVTACSFAGPVSFTGFIEFYDTSSLDLVYKTSFSHVNIGGTCELSNFNMKLNDSYYLFKTSSSEYKIFDIRNENIIETTVPLVNSSLDTNQFDNQWRINLNEQNGELTYPIHRILYTTSGIVDYQVNISINSIIDVQSTFIIETYKHQVNESQIRINSMKTSSSSDYFSAFSTYVYKSNETNFFYTWYYVDFETNETQTLTFNPGIELFDFHARIINSQDVTFGVLYKNYVENSEDPISYIYNLITHEGVQFSSKDFTYFQPLGINREKNEITVIHQNERIINDKPVSETYVATLNLSNMNQVISNQSFIDVNFVIPTDNYFIHAYYKTHEEVEFSTDIMVLALIFLPIMKLAMKKGKKRE